MKRIGISLFFIFFLSFHPVRENPFFGIAMEGSVTDTSELKAIETHMGFEPQIIEFFFKWPSLNSKAYLLFPTRSLDIIWKQSAIVCITWEPMIEIGGSLKTITAEEITNGNYDNYIRQNARLLKHWQKPVLIRLAHEMNLSHYHWGSSEEDFGPHSSEKYKRMFQYIVDLFKEEETTNVLWVFCPNVDSIPQTEWNRLENYYPGDSYVDILGMDGYNWGEIHTKEKTGWDSSWESFEDIFRTTYQQLRFLSLQKPIIVCETAAPPSPKRGEWLKKALLCAQKWNIQAVIWFQVKKETDWRLNIQETKDIKTLFTHQSPQKWAKELVDEKRKAHRSTRRSG